MLVLVGGQERSLAEYDRLLTDAAPVVEHVHQGKTCDVIVARKPSYPGEELTRLHVGC